MSERITIVQLPEADTIETSFIVKEKHLGFGKNGKSFLALQLGDATGAIDARIWDRAEELALTFDQGDVVKIKGQTQIFQGKKQLILHKVAKLFPNEFQIEDFLQKPNAQAEAQFEELVQIVQSFKNDSLKQLVLNTLQDPEIKPLLLRAPAAKTIHHAWVGGLMEHILSITKIMDFFSGHYPFLNRDLIIFGAIFHDIGKIWELSYEGLISYTDKGRLLGHMLMGCELVDKKASQVLGFSEELKDLCKHIILAHHGRLEYGSPKRPKCLEALFVAMIDDLDSKVSTVKTLIDTERVRGDKWSRYSESFDRYFLLEDLKQKFE